MVPRNQVILFQGNASLSGTYSASYKSSSSGISWEGEGPVSIPAPAAVLASGVVVTVSFAEGADLGAAFSAITDSWEMAAISIIDGNSPAWFVVSNFMPTTAANRRLEATVAILKNGNNLGSCLSAVCPALIVKLCGTFFSGHADKSDRVLLSCNNASLKLDQYPGVILTLQSGVVIMRQPGSGRGAASLYPNNMRS